MAKAITLKQPWAELCALGAKWIETRPFKTDYRGPLYIHSSQHFQFCDLELCYQEPEYSKHIPTPHSQCVTGKIVGCVMLDDVKLMDEALIDEFRSTAIGRAQLVMGNWKPGRYAWFLSHAVRFAKPVNYKGSLSIWEFDSSIVDETPLMKEVQHG